MASRKVHADIDFQSLNKGINHPDPTAAQDVATKNYVDTTTAPATHIGSGGASHSVATTTVNGFMSSADKVKLDAISANTIIKSGTIPAASFVGTPRVFTLNFTTAFPSTAYSIVVLGGNSRNWQYQTQTAASVVINSNANGALSQPVLWIAISHGESVE
jgi:hypothetical protein